MSYVIKQGDCFKLLNDLPSSSIDCVISDIPYGIGYEDWDVLHNNTNSAYGGFSPAQKKSDNFNRRGKPLNGWSKEDRNIGKEYCAWCKNWGESLYKCLKDGASVFIFAGRREAHQCINALEEAGFTFKDMIAWIKPQSIFKAQRVSKVFERRNDNVNAQKWEGWRLGNLSPDFEPILWFQKPYKIGSTLTDNLLKNEVGAFYSPNKTSNIFKSSNTIKSKLHPTQKPIDVLEWLISLSTLQTQTILDPFMGSGSTGVACLNTNRNFIGFELDEKYFEIAKERLNNT